MAISETSEHHLINKLLNDVINYVDQINSSFCRILFSNLTLRSVWERFWRLTRWECWRCMSRALGQKSLSRRTPRHSGSWTQCDQSASPHRLNTRTTKQVFTDEKNLYLNPPVSKQNSRVWSAGWCKADVRPDRLLVECKVCAAPDGIGWSVLWWQELAGVCGWSVLWWQEQAAVPGREGQIERRLQCWSSAAWTDGRLQPSPARRLHLPARWHPSAHGTRNTGLAASELSRVHWKESLPPPNFPDLNPLDYHMTLGHHTGNIPLTPAEARDDWWVESCFEDHLGRAATRPHQQGGGKLHQALDCLRCCQWLPVQASAGRVYPSPSLHPHLSTKKRLFSEPYRKQPLKRWKLEINFSKVVQQHYVDAQLGRFHCVWHPVYISSRQTIIVHSLFWIEHHNQKIWQNWLEAIIMMYSPVMTRKWDTC